MCGFAGYITRDSTNYERSLQEMLSAIEARGPDAQGTWSDVASGVHLGHRRLAIIDLSDFSKQPISSHSGNLVMVCNGEIYNFKELGAELNLPAEDLKSDMRVLVNAVEIWGLEKTLDRVRGMFAFAIYDRQKKQLYLARDAAGEKPLMYGYSNNRFYFGSTLFSLLACSEFRDLKVHSSLVHNVMSYGYVPGPHTALKDFYKLLPGHYVVVDCQHPEKPLAPRKYWSLEETVKNREPRFSTPSEAEDHLHTLLTSVVKRQSISDVSLGAFLSGGTDSSLVVSLMQKTSSAKVKTYSIGFTDQGYNEAEDAKRVAKHLGTDHTEFYVDDKTSFDIATDMASIYDEPFADFSQIPTTIISKMARKHVTVALTGDGGDETFLGYSRYFIFNETNNVLKKIPSPVLKMGISLGKHLPNSLLNSAYRTVLGKPYRGRLALQDRLKALSTNYNENPELGFYNYFISETSHYGVMKNGKLARNQWHDLGWRGALSKNSIESLAYRDTLAYMPDDIFVKVDRASMSQSLETRAPLVDRDILEFAWSLEEKLKIPNLTPKHLLKEILYKYVPKDMVDRPKRGFSLPIGSWLRKELRGFSRDVIAKSSQDLSFIIDPSRVQTLLDQHQNGQADFGLFIWRLTMLSQWVDRHRAKLSF